MDDRHERAEEPLRGILVFAAVLVASLAAIAFLVRGLHGPLTGLRVPDRPPAEDFAADLRAQRRAEEAVLNSYGWVDRRSGIVRIPIDRAMDLIVERGLPVRRPP